MIPTNGKNFDHIFRLSSMQQTQEEQKASDPFDLIDKKSEESEREDDTLFHLGIAGSFTLQSKLHALEKITFRKKEEEKVQTTKGHQIAELLIEKLNGLIVF
jgi:hypothetical protein